MKVNLYGLEGPKLAGGAVHVHAATCSHNAPKIEGAFKDGKPVRATPSLTLDADSKEQVARLALGQTTHGVGGEGLLDSLFDWTWAACTRPLTRLQAPIEEAKFVDEVGDDEVDSGGILGTFKVGESTVYFKTGKLRAGGNIEYVITVHTPSQPARRVARGTQASVLAALPAIIMEVAR